MGSEVEGPMMDIKEASDRIRFRASELSECGECCYLRGRDKNCCDCPQFRHELCDYEMYKSFAIYCLEQSGADKELIDAIMTEKPSEPCPFCGGYNIKAVECGKSHKHMMVALECSNCRARGPVKNVRSEEYTGDPDDYKDDLLDAWDEILKGER
jgi:hypothetical protein